MGQAWRTFHSAASVGDVLLWGKCRRRFSVGQTWETFLCGVRLGDVSVWGKRGRRFSVGDVSVVGTFQDGGRNAVMVGWWLRQ